jgi:hypothetical protein
MRIGFRQNEPQQRVLQDQVVAAWQACSWRKCDVSKAVPTITYARLTRYLDGDRGTFLRERSAEYLLSVLNRAPKGPKRD